MEIARTRNRGLHGLWLVGAAWWWALAPAGAQINGQPINPVYVDDSPTSSEAFLRVRDHVANGNTALAVTVLQSLLDDSGDRVVASPADKDLFLSVRDGVHKQLLGTPELLARYRQVQEPGAKQLLSEGAVARVERCYLLTPSGFEAALCLAQQQIEDARFEAARRTLEQLEGHPDRTGKGAQDAAALLGLVARYLDRAEVWQMAARWAGAGAERAREPVAWTECAQRRGLTPMDASPPADLDGVLGKPLRSVPMGVEPASAAPENGWARREQFPEFARELGAFPAITGDTVYVNDGSAISAWDRITLTLKWRYEPKEGPAKLEDEDPQSVAIRRAMARGPSGVEEPNSVTVCGRNAVAVTGKAVNGTREGNAAVHSLDAVTGALRWSVEVSQLDQPSLTGASVRGPAMVGEGVVVVAARRNMPERRLLSLHLIGLDAATGTMLWHRLVGSAGALPYRRDAYITDAGTLHQGVVYRSDVLGIVGAIDAATGRPLWVRRIASQANPAPDTSWVWQMGKPVIDGESLIILSPDRQSIVRLNRSTGVVVSVSRADRFGTPPPLYLIRAGGFLAGVGDDRIGLGPIDSFETASVRMTPPVPEPGIHGRVVASGDRLLVPIVTGLLLVSTSAPNAEPLALPLDSPGNVVALENQLVVVDDAYIHSYLLWEVAEKLLTDRMRDDPHDPTPAVTLAELSFRAGRHDRVLGAVDAALAALAAGPKSEQSEFIRARLFQAVHAMIGASQEPGRPATARTPDHPGSPVGEEPAANLRIADQALVSDLVDRLGKAALTADERVSYLLTRGRLLEGRADFVQAVDTYQAILDDPQLNSATWAGPRLSVRGELEATRRISTLIGAHGGAVYAKHDARARQEAAALGADAPVERVTALAARFPGATQAALLWERAADLFQRQGRAPAATGALESALDAAERIPDHPALPQIAGRLVTELENRGQIRAASALLTRLVENHPGLVLMSGGAPLDARARADSLSQRLATRNRWPAVGPVRSQGVQMLTGWSILEPLIRARTGGVARGLVLRSDDQVAVFVPGDQQAGGNASASELAPAWTKPLDGTQPELIRIDPDSAYLFFSTGIKMGTIEKVSMGPGAPASKWSVNLFSAIPESTLPRFKTDVRREERVETPQDGPTLLTDLVVAMDDATMAVMERNGRATGIDLETGDVLWTVHCPLDHVFDADLASGTLVVGGEQQVNAPGGGFAGFRPEVAVLDARTGHEVQRLPQRWGKVRWLRIAPSGALVTGLENAIVSTDLSRDQTNWVLSDRRLSGARDAWVFGDRLFVMDKDRSLWLASISTGRLNPEALEAPHSHLAGIRPVEAFGVGDAVAFSSFQGVLLYGPGGALAGVDAVGGFDALLPPVPGQGKLLTITTMPDGRRPDGELVYTIHSLDTSSAMASQSVSIILGAPPRALWLLDGRLIINAGGSTVVLQAPAGE